MPHMETALYDALIDAGANEAKARAAAEVMPLAEHLATKADIAELKASLETKQARLEVVFFTFCPLALGLLIKIAFF